MVGEIVHFVTDSMKCRAAIVTGRTDIVAMRLNLSVQADGPNDLDIGYDRPYWVGDIAYAPYLAKQPGTWHYMAEERRLRPHLHRQPNRE